MSTHVSLLRFSSHFLCALHIYLFLHRVFAERFPIDGFVTLRFGATYNNDMKTLQTRRTAVLITEPNVRMIVIPPPPQRKQKIQPEAIFKNSDVQKFNVRAVFKNPKVPINRIRVSNSSSYPGIEVKIRRVRLWAGSLQFLTSFIFARCCRRLTLEQGSFQHDVELHHFVA